MSLFFELSKRPEKKWSFDVIFLRLSTFSGLYILHYLWPKMYSMLADYTKIYKNYRKKEGQQNLIF